MQNIYMGLIGTEGEERMLLLVLLILNTQHIEHKDSCFMSARFREVEVTCNIQPPGSDALMLGPSSIIKST